MGNFFSRIDWQLWVAVLLLVGAGSLSIFSSTPSFFVKHIVLFVVALIIAVGIMMVDIRSFFVSRGFVFGLYWLIILTLIATYFFAPVIKGNRAWLSIGAFQFQPSEFAKVALIIVLAYFFSKRHIGIARWRVLAVSFIYAAIPAGLIAIQPDLGSAIVLGAIWLGFVLASGIPLKRLLVVGGVFALGLVLAWSFVLKNYQKDRIVGIFNPDSDPLGVNYNVIQSKIAIGSGGLLGKGFEQGTQVQLGFLPESHNDFIFAAIAEEGGFVAVVLVLGIFTWMVVRLLTLGLRMEGNTYKLLALGASALFVAQCIFHTGSNLGFLPVIGTTLPFVSYGGSSMLSSMILIGIVQSVYARN